MHRYGVGRTGRGLSFFENPGIKRNRQCLSWRQAGEAAISGIPFKGNAVDIESRRHRAIGRTDPERNAVLEDD